MALDIMGLFNTQSVNPYQQQQQAFQQNLMQSTNPQQFVATLGTNMGGQIAGAIPGMFGIKSEEEKKNQAKKEALAEVQSLNIDPTDKVAVGKALVNALQSRNLTAEAMQVGQSLEKVKADTPSDLKTLLQERTNHPEGTPERAYYDNRIKLLTQGKPAAEEASPQIVLLQKARDALAANNKNDPRIAEIQKQIDKLGTPSKGTQITLGIPGLEEPADIPKLRLDVQASVKPYSQAIDAADTVITAINLGIKEGNFVAAKGATTALLKAFGDGQISRQEVLSAGADPSIVGGGIDYVNQLFTGTPSTDTMNKIKKTAEALKKINSDKRNKELDLQRKLAVKMGIKEDDMKDIFSGFDSPSKTIVKTGVDKKTGRRVNKYSDGSVGYAD